MVSSALDGRMGCWTLKGKPLWGLRGLQRDVPLPVAADAKRLLLGGLVLNPETPGEELFASR